MPSIPFSYKKIIMFNMCLILILVSILATIFIESFIKEHNNYNLISNKRPFIEVSRNMVIYSYLKFFFNNYD